MSVILLLRCETFAKFSDDVVPIGWRLCVAVWHLISEDTWDTQPSHLRAPGSTLVFFLFKSLFSM